MIKKLILVAASVFLIGQSYGIVRNIPYLENDSLWFLTIMAWLINMFITGVFAFAGFALPTERLLLNSYYQVTKPKKLKQIFKIFKVEWFREFLLATVWRSKDNQKKFFDGTKEGIANFEKQSKKSEFGHLIPFVITTFISIYCCSIGFIRLGILTMILNILGNLYPIILQRHHRMRIQIVKKRMSRKGRK